MISIPRSLIPVLLFMTGCSSFSSQLVDRDHSNTCWSPRKTGGIPITVKVPTHIRVNVIQECYYQDGSPWIGADGQQVRSNRVEHEPIETTKIFTIDPKRPAAGTAHPVIDFAGQYPSNITNDVNDQTIAEIGKLIERVNGVGGIGSLFLGRTASQGGGTTDTRLVGTGLFHIDHVVATQLFEIDDPMVESKIEAYLNQYLNNCHLAAGH